MKVRTIGPLIVVAAAITFCEWAYVMGNDSFTAVDGRKVFIYGFPFSVPWYPKELGTEMATWEVLLRLLGNFTAALLGCALLAWLAALVRVKFHKKL
jgi:hypothetical protein